MSNCNLLLGESLKACGDRVAFVAKRQERLDKAPLLYFLTGCISVGSLVALEVDGKFELFEGFFEFAAVVGVRHVCLRCLCSGEVMFALCPRDIKSMWD